jgi:hypothetical protein
MGNGHTPFGVDNCGLPQDGTFVGMSTGGEMGIMKCEGGRRGDRGVWDNGKGRTI